MRDERGFWESFFVGALTALFLIICAPAVVLLIGWGFGFMAELVSGDFIANTLNMMFNTERFVKGDFARITAVLAAVSGVFSLRMSSGKD